MIKVDGGNLEVKGMTETITAELAYLLKGVQTYLIQDKSDAYGHSAMAVSQARANGRKLDVLKKEAQQKKEQQQTLGY